MHMRSLRITFLIALAVAALLLAGCRGGDDDDDNDATEAPQAADLQIDIAYDPDPIEPRDDDSVVVVTVMDAEGNPVEGATVALFGDMDMAMPPETGETTEGEAGVYRVPFFWSMGGEWFLDVTVTLPDGTEVTRAFTLDVGGDAGDMDDMDMDATDEAGMDMEGHG